MLSSLPSFALRPSVIPIYAANDSICPPLFARHVPHVVVAHVVFLYTPQISFTVSLRGHDRLGLSCSFCLTSSHFLPPLVIQFFVTLGPTPWLDGKHTILGRISSGMKVRRNRPISQRFAFVLREWGTLTHYALFPAGRQRTQSGCPHERCNVQKISISDILHFG